MAITAEPLLDEEEVPLAVLSADTAAAVEELGSILEPLKYQKTHYNCRGIRQLMIMSYH
jgi:hypothetical protein